MKGVWLFFVFSCMFLFLQAGTYRKREVSRPCFITTNTSKIEIKKIILTDEQTQVDAVLYGEPGELLLSLRKHVCVPRSKNLACVKLKGCLLMEKPSRSLFRSRGSIM